MKTNNKLFLKYQPIIYVLLVILSGVALFLNNKVLVDALVGLTFIILFLVYKLNPIGYLFVILVNLPFQPTINTSFDFANTNIEILVVFTFLFIASDFKLLIRNYKPLKLLYWVQIISLPFLLIPSINSFSIKYSLLGVFDVIVFYLFIIFVFDLFKNELTIKSFTEKTISVFLILILIRVVFEFTPLSFINENKNVFGGILDLFIPLATIYSIKYKSKLRLAIVFVSLVYLVLNDSRGSLIAVILSLLIYFIILNKKSFVKNLKYIVLVLVVMCGSVFFLSPHIRNRFMNMFNVHDYNAYTRLGMWKASLDIFAKHPIFGIGLQNFKFFYKKYFPYYGNFFHPHNGYLYALVSTGIAGVIILAAMLFLYFRYFVKEYSKLKLTMKPSSSLILIGFAFSFVALGIHDLIDTMIIYPSILLFIAVFVGASLKLFNLGEGHESSR